MSNQPSQVWVEAAQKAAARAFEAIGDMGDCDLGLTLVHKDDATATNSKDRAFLDLLEKREHLDSDFLANAR